MSEPTPEQPVLEFDEDDTLVDDGDGQYVDGVDDGS